MNHVSEKNFRTIGEAAASLVETGTLRIGTGSAKPVRLEELADDRTDPLDALPRLIKPIVSVPTALLLNYLRFGHPTRIVSEDDLFTLQRLAFDFVGLSQPSSLAEVIEVMTMIASVIQVDLPMDEGLKAYAALLHRLPRHVLKEAALEILQHHAYRTMPLPVEFLSSPAARVWEDTVEWFHQLMPGWQAQLRNELEQRKETTNAPHHALDPPDLPLPAGDPARGGRA